MVKMFDIFSDEESAKRFLDNCEENDVCLNGDCHCHNVLSLNGPLKLFRLYLSGTASPEPWYTSRACAENVDMLLTTEEFSTAITEAIELKKTDECGTLQAINSLAGSSSEYSLINVREPYQFNDLIRNERIFESFFSVFVAEGDSLSAVVPRSLITIVHILTKKESSWDSEEYAKRIGVPPQLLAVAKHHGDDLMRLLGSKGEKICWKREGPPKKNEVERLTAGVLETPETFSIDPASIRIQNPSVALNYGCRSALEERLSMNNEDSEDDEESEEMVEDQEEEEEEKDKKKQILLTLDDMVKASGVIGYAVLKDVWKANGWGDRKAIACMTRVKNTHGEVCELFNVEHKILTVFPEERESDENKLPLYQFIVVAKKDTDGFNSIEPVYVNNKPSGTYSLKTVEDGVMCFMLPPPGQTKMVHYKMRASAYSEDMKGALRPAAWKEFFSDYRLAYLVNTVSDFATFDNEGFRLLVFNDLLLKIYAVNDVVKSYYRWTSSKWKGKDSDVLDLVSSFMRDYSTIVTKHKHRIITGSARSVPKIAGYKRLLSSWYKTKSDEVFGSAETNMADLVHTAGSRQGIVMTGMYKDDDNGLYNHDADFVSNSKRLSQAVDDAARSQRMSRELFVSEVCLHLMLNRKNMNVLGFTDSHNMLALSANDRIDVEEHQTCDDDEEAEQEESDEDVESDQNGYDENDGSGSETSVDE